MPPKGKKEEPGKKEKKKSKVVIPKELASQFDSRQLEIAIGVFEATDKKGEGFIDVGEIGFLLRLSGGNPTEGEINEWMDAAQGENGKMDLLSFLQIAALELRTRKTNDDIMVAFTTFDSDSSGFVKGEVLREQLCKNGERFPDNVVQEFMMEAMNSMDSEGKINYGGFIAQMSQDAERAWNKKAKKMGIPVDDDGGGKKGKKKKKK